jgi:hypothetical protein
MMSFLTLLNFGCEQHISPDSLARQTLDNKMSNKKIKSRLKTKEVLVHGHQSVGHNLTIYRRRRLVAQPRAPVQRPNISPSEQNEIGAATIKRFNHDSTFEW